MNLKNTFVALTSAFMLTTGCAFADGNAFTPLNFDDTSYTVPATTTSKASTSSSVQGITESTSSSQATGNLDLQSAIAKIDAALDDIRTEQNACKAKFAEIDNQYKFVKNERSNMKKQIRANDKRIKSLNNAKKNVGKSVL